MGSNYCVGGRYAGTGGLPTGLGSKYFGDYCTISYVDCGPIRRSDLGPRCPADVGANDTTVVSRARTNTANIACDSSGGSDAHSGAHPRCRAAPDAHGDPGPGSIRRVITNPNSSPNAYRVANGDIDPGADSGSLPGRIQRTDSIGAVRAGPTS